MSKESKVPNPMWCAVFDQKLNGGNMAVKATVGVSWESEREPQLCACGTGVDVGERNALLRRCISELITLTENWCFLYTGEKKRSRKRHVMTNLNEQVFIAPILWLIVLSM